MGIVWTDGIFIVIAAILAWLNFVFIDVALGLPERPGVRGAKAIATSIEDYGGDINGGYMMGNIVCSPDASAGTLLASSCFCAFGSWMGGVFAAAVVLLGNRICSDPGYAGTTGALTITGIITAGSLVGLAPKHFIVGMIIAIATIQAIHHRYSSRLISKIATKMGVI